ncbi:MAG: hypothetical protein ABIZ49_08735 [Opitutaceae bacterium]
MIHSVRITPRCFCKTGLFALALLSGFAAQIPRALAQAPASAPAAAGMKGAVGMFEAHGDIGIAPAAGDAVFDAAKQTYTITGGGNNMWAKVDAFHFAWKKMAGDLSFAADIAFQPNPTGPSDPHRKACLIIRQSLDADAAYIDATTHGDGLTALQFRDSKGAPTREVMSNVVGPVRMRIEKRGDTFTLYVGKAGEEPKYSGASYNLKFTEPFYVGFAVGAHNGNDTATRVETVLFSKVELKTNLPMGAPQLYSTLETQASNPVNANQTQNTDRVVLYVTPGSIEGPLWLPDNSGVVFSRGGRLYKLPIRLPVRERLPDGKQGPVAVTGAAPLAAGEPVLIDTGKYNAVTRSHGLSADGTQIIFVDRSQGTPAAGQQRPPANTYLVPVGGGTPKLLTPNTGAGSSLSPDGKTFAFDTDTTPDIFTIPVDGSAPAKRLTTGLGRNYGPQFTPDGNAILFCSDRSGSMQIWKMKPDGSEPTQLTQTESNNWFPRLSPNGTYAAFVTYPKDMSGDPPNSAVEVRRLNLTSGANDQMARIVGGPASSPTFSPSNTQLTFVSYQTVY